MDKKEFEVLEIGNMPVILAGVATTVLAIIGLANILPKALVSISAIAIGAALILVGIAVAVEKRHILAETIEGKIGSKMMTAGIGMEMIAGIASIVLGILSLLKMDPAILLGVDAIIVGLALLDMCSSDSRMNSYRAASSTASKKAYLRESVSAIIDIQFLVGLGMITLGILALIGITPVVLILVAFLAGGVVLGLKGTTLAARLSQEHKETVQ